MGYKKIVDNDYILGVAEVENEGNITFDEYDEITRKIHDMPKAPDGYYYKLKTDFSLELVELIEHNTTIEAEMAEQMPFGGDIE